MDANYNPYYPDTSYQPFRDIGDSTRLISGPEEYYELRKHPGERTTRYSAAEESVIPNDRPDRFSGWRFGARLSALCATIAFAANTAWTIWGLVKTKPFSNGSGGIGTIFEGDCTQARKLDLWVHLAINALSTMLLGGTNYTQQSLVAPTREEVDAAHQRRVWLDIGTQSMRNLPKIASGRRWLWVLLSLSSVPLHLLYNSCVFSTISASVYSVNITTSTMLETSSAYKTSSSWTDLTNAQCISAFQHQLVSSWTEVLVVVDGSANETLLFQNNPIKPGIPSMGNFDPVYNWMCQDMSCSSPIAASSWQIPSADGSTFYSVQNCYAKPAVEHCKVQFIPSLMAVVILCNVVKVICITKSFWRKGWNGSLVTVGDAIASYLDRPDPTTINACMLYWKPFKWESSEYRALPRQWKAKRWRWFSAVSRLTWIISHTLYAITIGVGSYLLSLGLSQISGIESTSLKGLWSNGVGTADINELINFSGTDDFPLIPMILLANTPQVLLSFLYLFFNGILTSMLLEQEWNSLGVERQPLRVSSPRGKQLSSHFLSLPKLYAIPLMIFFASLHWILSQSIFLVRVDFYDADDSMQGGNSISTCGYSNIAIIGAIVVGSLGVIVNLGIGFRRFRPGIPSAVGCSAAISAACHRPEEDEDASLERVKWGVVKGGGSGSWVREEPYGHCCITSLEVVEPVEGMMYA